MRLDPTFSDVNVTGGQLRVAMFGSGPETILGIHGVTASALSLAPVARYLGEETALVAPDLRGRGGSAGLPGPYGMRAHALDCAAVLDFIGAGSSVVIGESMGAFVAVVLAAVRPDLVERLVLVDGGLPLAAPAGLDPDAILDAILGPALARLKTTFASRRSYVEFWQGHPSFSDLWSEDLEAYVLYDLQGDEPELRSRVSENAVRADGADTLTNPDQVPDALRALRCPVHLLRATRNLVNEPPPLISDQLVATWRNEVPQLTDEIIADTNHYSIMFGDRGVRAIAAKALGSTVGV